MEEQSDAKDPAELSGGTGSAPEAEKARAERIQREKEQLLSDIAARLADDLKRRVGYVLSHYPQTRDSDVALMIRLWETFFEDRLQGESVELAELYHLPRLTSIARVRAKIQNEYGLFAASPEVEKARKGLEEEVEGEVTADKPGPPIISVHSDESGKAARFLIVGSVWVLDGLREWRLVLHLKDWKQANGMAHELKFAELTPKTLPLAMAFTRAAMEFSDILSFKACVLDTTRVKGASVEDLVYRLYYELLMSGMEHELGTGRITLPRWLSLIKDADDASDVLNLPDLRRRLTV